MNVEELITELQCHDGDLRVVFADWYGIVGDVDDVFTQRVTKDEIVVSLR